MQSIEWFLKQGPVIFESIGILAFAISGLVVALEKRLDLVGLAMVAAFTAFGGGTLRDVLLDRRPFFWVQNQEWVYAILLICVLALIFVRQRHLDYTAKAILIPDAVGLGIFSAGGTQVALGSGVPPLVAVIMGTFTAIMGGVLRDISVGTIPRAFNDHQPYSVIAFGGAWIVVLGELFQWSSTASLYASAFAITFFRIVAVYRGWRLPSIRLVGRRAGE